MVTKTLLKKEIDKLPKSMLEKAYKLLNSIRSTKPAKKRAKKFKLGGKFDDVNVREYAYRKNSD